MNHRARGRRLTVALECGTGGARDSFRFGHVYFDWSGGKTAVHWGRGKICIVWRGARATEKEKRVVISVWIRFTFSVSSDYSECSSPSVVGTEVGGVLYGVCESAVIKKKTKRNRNFLIFIHFFVSVVLHSRR